MFKRRILDFVVVTLFCYLLTLNGYCAQNNRRHQNRNAQRSNQNSQTHRPEASLPGNLHNAYLDAFDAQAASQQVTPTAETVNTPNEPPRRSRENRGWGRFAPSVPSLEDSDCFVHITRLRGGICTQLGGNGENRLYICQSGDRLEFQPECGDKIAERLQRNPTVRDNTD